MAKYAIPQGYGTVTSYLIVEQVEVLIDFLQRAFATESKVCERNAAGQAIHGEVKVGDSWVMIGQASQTHAVTSSQLYLYLSDVDQSYAQMLAAGGQSIMDPVDKDYGDRLSGVRDPAGNTWWLASRL